MAEEEKTNDLPDEIDDEVSAEAQAEEAPEVDEDVAEENEAPAPAPERKKDRSKIYLNTDPKTAKEKKKKKEPGKVRRWFRDFFSELKKVTWPSFSKVLRQTGTVLMVTVAFLLVLLAFDSLFGVLHDLLLTGLKKDTAAAVYSLVNLGRGGLL